MPFMANVECCHDRHVQLFSNKNLLFALHADALTRLVCFIVLKQRRDRDRDRDKEGSKNRDDDANAVAEAAPLAAAVTAVNGDTSTPDHDGEEVGMMVMFGVFVILLFSCRNITCIYEEKVFLLIEMPIGRLLETHML